MRVLPQNNGTVRDFYLGNIKEYTSIIQHSTIFLACDSYKDNDIKNVERI